MTLTTDQPTATISGPVPTTGLQEDASYYEVVVTYQDMPLRYRLHNEWDYGIDCRGAMPDYPNPDRWYGTYMTPGALELPAETVQALRAIWESLFRPAPTLTPTSAPAITKRVGEYDPITKDYAAYVSIDNGPEEYIGSRKTQGAADRLCDEYAYNFYADHHTPEKAVEIALAMDEPEPAPPVDDGPADNWGGFRSTNERPAWTAADQAHLDALDGLGPWPTPDPRPPTPDPRPAAKVNWSSRPAASCPIPCEDLRTLYTQDPAIYRLRLAALSTSDLEQQARVYAAYHSAVTGGHVTVEETLARFRRSVAIYRAQAALRPASDDACAVLAELALTDPCALAEFLRAHTPTQRDQLAWRYAAWLSRHHGITVLPAYIASNWTALLGDTETDAGRAVDAQRCAESGS